ncbi:KOW domain-containing RNA-binding protein [Carboxydothermus pertinax]|uniref:RNA-binding protein n=1 Tax=Carboxydothermus pertinax TaxID=870242 RepID=A0A1L8CY73_9THEO|nr:KOW domain-containing RNA-binding protein [Carboxydothermus pertinax]GAV23843.1 hypothetical protein cpu_23530 [Carboxydothermus pertinax]
MHLDKIRPGQVVLSIAGRDIGTIYLIYRVIDDRYVEVVDGQHRRVENPKKKNVRHLKFLNHHVKEISEMLQTYGKVSNQEIRKVLKSIANRGEELDG